MTNRAPAGCIVVGSRYAHCAAVFALVVLCVSRLTADAAPERMRSELEIKAEFVMNFIRLVNWKNLPDDRDAGNLPVCALANSDFSDAVKKIASGKQVGDRIIQFRLEPNPDPQRCRVLLVDANQYKIASSALNPLRNFPVLTIGNGPGLTEVGGMFDLVVEERKVRFDSNLDAVRRSNLDVSPRMLRLSRNARTLP